MALRELMLTLGIEVDKKGEQDALSATQKIRAAAGAAAVAFGAMKAKEFVKNTVEEIRGLGDELDKTSLQIGVSTDALQELRHVAGLAGVGALEMTDALAKLQKNAYEAATGNKTLAEDFAQLGVSVTDAAGNVKSGEQLLAEMADGMTRLDNDTAKVGLSMNLLGRSGKRLLPLLNQGSQAINEQREEARLLGGVFDKELIASTVQLTDDQARLQMATRGLKAIVAKEFLPAIIESTQELILLAKAVQGPLSRAFLFFRRIGRGFGQMTKFLEERLGTFGTALDITIKGLGLLGVAFLLIGKQATIAGIKVAAAWLIANAPIILMIALLAAIGTAIFLLIEDFVAMGEGAESVTGTIVQGFLDLVDELGGVGAAILSIFTTAFTYWLPGVSQAISDVISWFGGLFDWLVGQLTFIGSFWSETFTSAWDGLKSILDTARDYWSGIFEGMWNVVQDIINRVTGAFDGIKNTLGGVASFFGFGGQGQPGNPAGVTTASAAAPTQPGVSMVNQPSTAVDVQVDASGAADAKEVGAEVARQVDLALQRRDRQTSQAYREALAGG